MALLHFDLSSFILTSNPSCTEEVSRPRHMTPREHYWWCNLHIMWWDITCSSKTKLYAIMLRVEYEVLRIPCELCNQSGSFLCRQAQWWGMTLHESYNTRKAKRSACALGWCILPSGMFYHPRIVHIHTLGLEMGVLATASISIVFPKGRQIFATWAFSVGSLFMRSGSK